MVDNGGLGKSTHNQVLPYCFHAWWISYVLVVAEAGLEPAIIGYEPIELAATLLRVRWGEAGSRTPQTGPQPISRPTLPHSNGGGWGWSRKWNLGDFHRAFRTWERFPGTVAFGARASHSAISSNKANNSQSGELGDNSPPP